MDTESYHLVMTPEYHEIVARGAFDHWQGETVPLRGLNREIVGEATITSVDHREDGNVYVAVTVTHTEAYKAVAQVANLMRGREPMSFSLKPEDVVPPFQPKRDDAVARWLKRTRDSFEHHRPGVGSLWLTVNDLLEEYRARADYGLTLDADLSELPEGY